MTIEIISQTDDSNIDIGVVYLREHIQFTKVLEHIAHVEILLSVYLFGLHCGLYVVGNERPQFLVKLDIKLLQIGKILIIVLHVV